MSRGTRGARRLPALLASSVLVVSGCSMFAEDSPQDEAVAFAEALASGELGGIGLTARSPAQPAEWWSGIREGMGESTLSVAVTTVSEPEDDRATATLSHSWSLGGETSPTWSYETTVPLVRGDDTWVVDLSADAVVAGLAEGEHLDLSTLTPGRGDILGAGGRPLVTERPVVRFGIDKTQVGPADQAASARALAQLLDVDADELAGRVEAAGDKAFVEAIVLREEDVTARVGAGVDSIPGAGGIADELPLAPTREFARPILGTVGPVTAEIIEEAEGAYAVGDVAGLSGLQQRYDERLRGVPGTVVEAVDDKTGEARELYRSDPEDGRPLRTTLDADLQLLAEQALAGVGPPSALVALRPSTGELLAVASGPGSAGYSTATLGQYAPGSTFKVVSSLALLRAGMSPDDPVSCPSTTVVDGKRFKNYSDYPAGSLGRITLTEAVAQSCNTAFVSQHDRMAPDDLAAAAGALGLGEDHDIGLPAYFGAVPSEGSQTERAASLIGQGRVLASPMAMAAVAGSVASGATVVPRLLAGTEVGADPERPLTAEEARRLRQLMTAVVERGSGAALADVPGAQVLAKTGTAEFGEQDPPRTHAWMVAAQGDLAVAVFVEVGESGSRTAGPILETFLRGVG